MADRRGTKDSVKSGSDWVAEQHSGDATVGDQPPAPAAVQVVSRGWARRFGTQFTALFKKNLLVNWRNLRSTILRILAPL
jgi:hypothetical protein